MLDVPCLAGWVLWKFYERGLGVAIVMNAENGGGGAPMGGHHLGVGTIGARRGRNKTVCVVHRRAGSALRLGAGAAGTGKTDGSVHGGARTGARRAHRTKRAPHCGQWMRSSAFAKRARKSSHDTGVTGSIGG